MLQKTGKYTERTVRKPSSISDEAQAAFSHELKRHSEEDITNKINEFIDEQNIDQLAQEARFAQMLQLSILFEPHAKPTQARSLSHIKTMANLLISQRQLIRKSEEREKNLEQKNRELSKTVMTDELTGALNRRGIWQAINHQKAEMQRYNNDGSSHRSFAIVFIDLNGFKAINDNFGHDKGDEILIQVAERLRESLKRHTDSLGRYGGDEFVFVLPYDSETGQHEHFDEAKVREKIEQAFEGIVVWDKDADRPYPITAAIGVGLFEGKAPDTNAAALLKEIDTAMYNHKTSLKDYLQNMAINAAYKIPKSKRQYAPIVKKEDATSVPAHQSPEGPAQG